MNMLGRLKRLEKTAKKERDARCGCCNSIDFATGVGVWRPRGAIMISAGGGVDGSDLDRGGRKHCACVWCCESILAQIELNQHQDLGTYSDPYQQDLSDSHMDQRSEDWNDTSCSAHDQRGAWRVRHAAREPMPV